MAAVTGRCVGGYAEPIVDGKKLHVTLSVKHDEEGEYVELAGQGCRLEGFEPGKYRPVPEEETG